MLKQNQQLKILQKISPQQIQFIKLLQVPTASLEQRIKEELEKNPALEDSQMGFGEEAPSDEYDDYNQKEEENHKEESEDVLKNEISLDDYLSNDPYDYRTRLPRGGDDEEILLFAAMILNLVAAATPNVVVINDVTMLLFMAANNNIVAPTPTILFLVEEVHRGLDAT